MLIICQTQIIICNMVLLYHIKVCNMILLYQIIAVILCYIVLYTIERTIIGTLSTIISK